MKKSIWRKMEGADGLHFWYREVMDLTAYVTRQVKNDRPITYSIVMMVKESEVGPSFKNIKGLKNAKEIGNGLLGGYLSKCINLLTDS